MPKCLCGAAFDYVRKQQSWLIHVFHDGWLKLSNSRAERSIRLFAIGRTNWLFSNMPLGARVSAVIYSFVEVAKANGLNLIKFLEYLDCTAMWQSDGGLPSVASIRSGAV